MQKLGWIKIYRQLLDWEWYDDANTFRLFFHLLLKANHKPKKYRGVDIPIGAVMTGREKLSIETGLSVQGVRTALKNLLLTNEITSEISTFGSVIQLVNYKSYQAVTNESTRVQPEPNQSLTNESTRVQPEPNQSLTTNKNVKKEKNDKELKNDKEESNIPPFDEFKIYAISLKPKADVLELRLKYESWVQNKWHDGHDNKIKNWKSKIANTLKYIGESKSNQIAADIGEPKSSKGKVHKF
ncbi:MAG: hypothetical protein COA58_03250 [Bacteroidetes bacterium]|nr:MAG: hypothetical protein COA58_03250 [Bacteroidota bacterium]